MKKRISSIWLTLVVSLVILALCGTAWGVELIPNLIAHWTFDEGSGATAYDSVGDNHGTIYGALWTIGQIDGALRFDGVDDYVDLDAHIGDFQDLSAGTLSVWIKKESTGNSGIFFSSSDGGDNYSSMYFAKMPDEKIKIRISQDDNSKLYWNSDSIVPFGWHHFAYTTGPSGNRAYLDGVALTGSHTVGSPLISAFFSRIPDQDSMRIGNLHKTDNDYFHWDGLIDDVRIYDRALSLGEVRQLYLDGLGEVVGLEIVGPNEVAEDFSASYKVIAYYDNNSTKDVTDSADWQVEPNSVASIEAGLLTTERIEILETITIYAQYTFKGVTVEAEMTVQVYSLVGLEITGPEKVPESSQTQYEATAHYSNGGTKDVTDLALWSVEPEESGNINENGVLTTERIEMPEDITIYAQYTEAGVTIEAEMTVRVSLPVDLEITGPEEVAENSTAQYSAIALYEPNYTGDVTNFTIWSLEPQECGSINENGVLTVERIEILENITIYAQYTVEGITLQAEMTVRVSPPVDLEITGPEEVWGTNPAQYEAVVYYDNGQTDTVTDSALWWVEPNSLETIIDEHGLLHTERIETPQETITIYAQYTAAGITLQTEMTVRVSLPVDLEITGPQEVRSSCSAQYEVVVYYDNGQTDTVTDSALWWAEPNTLATIEAGLLWTEDINEPRDIIIYSQYTVTGVTLQAEMAVAVTLPQTLYVPSEYETIQAAIDVAKCNDTIIVADGTYTGPGNRDIDFLGKAITVRSESGPENCIINCEGRIADRHRGFYFYNNEDANSILAGFTIINGYAWQGGGISCWASSPTISNCTITGNTANGGGDDGGGGGGISCWRDSSPVISNCTINENKAGWGGGGIYCYEYSNPVITNCTISGNIADSEGESPYGRPVGRGGGIRCSYRSNSTITNCTITQNSAAVDGGGISCYFGSNLTITNSILWANESPDGSEIYLEHESSVVSYESSAVVSYCDVQGSWPGEGNIDEDPHFALSTDYHLMPDSACIDAGTNDPCGGLTVTDIDGNPRPMDGNGDGTAVADMGAYEFNPNSPSIAVSATTFSFLPNWPQPHPQTLLIRNCGGTTLHWQIVQDCNWLEVVPTTGVSTGNINEVTLTVDTNSLAPGYYTCILQVHDSNAASSPVIVQVVLHVGALLRVPSPDFPTIQAAIDAADDYDIVLVADGNYTGQGNTNLDFKGKSITVQSENGPNNCTINYQDYGYAFFFYSGETAHSRVEGFTITNSNSGWGGGISCWDSSPTIKNCNIIENQGGGIYCDYSSPTITKCTISDNSAEHFGGGIFCWESSPIITNCTITGNKTDWEGGGIFCWDSSPTITNCTITGNSAQYYGGGISCWESSLTITNCTITGNSAQYYGGGIYCYDSSPTVTNCTISGNSAQYYGGGIDCDWYSNPTITNCTITGNSAQYNGGGIYCENNSNLTLTNCTFTGNSASNGNALATDSWRQQRPSNIKLANCILWDGGNEIWNNDGSTITITYSDVQGSWPGEGNIDADPCFVDPGYWDMNDVWVDGDYHLLRTSPCIDAGDNTAVPADTTDLDGDGNTAEPIPWDLDGNPRIVDGNDDGNLVVDMGPFEAMVSCFGVNHVKLETKAGKKGNKVELKGTFAPALPIDFAVDDVAYIINDGQGNALAFLIPAGSFEPDGEPEKQKFKFDSPKHSQPDIKAKFDFDKCRFELKAKGVPNTDEITSTTLTIELWAGANVVEEVVEVQVKPKQIEYKREPKLSCCPKCKGIALLEVTSDQGVFMFEPEPGKEKLKAKTVVDDGVNGPVKIDTSCSKPLEVGDVFGVYTVTDLIKIFDDWPDDENDE